MTRGVRWAEVPGNVRPTAWTTGLARDSVVDVSQRVTLDRSTLRKLEGRLPDAKLDRILREIDIVLGRP